MLWMILFIVAVIALVAWVSIAEDRRQRLYANQLLERQAERAVSAQKAVGQHSWHTDLDYQRLCRVVAIVAEEALDPPGIRVDPARLEPGDSLYKDLGYTLDSLAACNLVAEIETEFQQKLKCHQLQQVSTIQELFQVVFPDKCLDVAIEQMDPAHRPPDSLK